MWFCGGEEEVSGRGEAVGGGGVIVERVEKGSMVAKKSSRREEEGGLVRGWNRRSGCREWCGQREGEVCGFFCF